MAETIVIKVVNGPAGAEATFSSSFTSGRSKGADFIVNSPMFSRQHARVYYDERGTGTCGASPPIKERWWVVDSGGDVLKLVKLQRK